MRRNLLGGLAFLALAACRMDARQQTPPPDVAGARAFVVDFYAWYFPGTSGMKNIDTLMATRRSALDPELAAMIDADNACMARTHGACNLEEDPVLAAQDPCERYEVGGGMAHGDTVGVSVFAVCEGKRDTVPSVIAMVIADGGKWRFANFVYPAEKTDLRAILGRSGAERAGAPTAISNTPPSDPQAFVAAFYSWYTPDTGPGHSVDDALKERRAWLGSGLAAALDSDRACLAKSGGEICGLDFDPFWNGQDTCGPFRVGQALAKNGGFEVPVFSACPSNAKDTVPWLVVVVRSDSGANRIVNLRYPNHRADVFILIKQAHQQ